VTWDGVDRRSADSTRLEMEQVVGNVINRRLLALVLVLFLQFGSFVWGASALHSTVATVVADVALMQGTHRTNQEAKMDLALQNQKIEALTQTDERLSASMEAIAKAVSNISVNVAVMASHAGLPVQGDIRGTK